MTEYLEIANNWHIICTHSVLDPVGGRPFRIVIAVRKLHNDNFKYAVARQYGTILTEEDGKNPSVVWDSEWCGGHYFTGRSHRLLAAVAHFNKWVEEVM